MDYYSEYSENLNPNTFVVVKKDEIELKQNRILFDNYKLHYGQTGRVLMNLNGILPGSPIVQWRLNYNCFTLIRESLKNIFVELDSKGFMNHELYIKTISIISLINSILKKSNDFNQHLKEPIIYCLHIFNMYVENNIFVFFLHKIFVYF